MKKLLQIQTFLCLVILLMLSSSGSVFGQLYVNPATGSDTNAGTAAAPFQSLREALRSLPGPGTTIYIQAGDYPYSTMTNNRNRNLGFGPGQTVTTGINNAFLPGTTIEGEGCVFWHNSDDNGTGAQNSIFTLEAIDGFTVRNINFLGWQGTNHSMGFLNCTNVLIEDCVFHQSALNISTALRFEGTSLENTIAGNPPLSLTINGTIFQNNGNPSGQGTGQALLIYNRGTTHLATGAGQFTVDVNNSVFSCNFASTGGAVYSTNANDSDARPEVTFTGCDFSGNYASSQGGAVFAADTDLTFSNSSFCGNETAFLTDRDGGAIHADDDAILVVDGCVFQDNIAGRDGSAISVASNATSAIITNSVFNSNDQGAATGNVIYAGNGSTTVDQCLLINNFAGGAAIEGPTVTNTTLVGNSGGTVTGTGVTDDHALVGTWVDETGHAFLSDGTQISYTGAFAELTCDACLPVPAAGNCNANAGSSLIVSSTCFYICSDTLSTTADISQPGSIEVTDVAGWTMPCDFTTDYHYYFLVVDAAGNVVAVIDGDADANGIPNFAETPSVSTSIDLGGITPPGVYDIVGYYSNNATAPMVGDTTTALETTGCADVTSGSTAVTILEAVRIDLSTACKDENGVDANLGEFFVNINEVTGGFANLNPSFFTPKAYSITTNFGAGTYTYNVPSGTPVIDIAVSYTDGDFVTAQVLDYSPQPNLCFDCDSQIFQEPHKLCIACPDIVDGSLSAEIAAAAVTDVCSGDIVTVCVDVDLTNDATAVVEFSNDGGTTWTPGTATAPTQFCLDFTETNTACDASTSTYQAQFVATSLADQACDIDLQTQDATPADVTVNVYPDVATVAMPMLSADGECGPSLTQSCPNYVITNGFDANAGTPDFTSTLTAGNVVFTITNPAAPTALVCATATVNATFNCTPCLSPVLTTLDTPTICNGDMFDIATVTVADASAGTYPANAIVTTTFHSGTPATAANILPATMVSPTTTTTYYILYTNDNETPGANAPESDDDCFDELAVTVTVLALPQADITNGDAADTDADGDEHTVSICSNNTVAGTLTLLAGDNAIVTMVDVAAAPNVTGGVTAMNDILASGATIETGTLVNTGTVTETIVYTICPYNFGPDGVDDSATGDDCVATVVENTPATDANCVTYTVNVLATPKSDITDGGTADEDADGDAHTESLCSGNAPAATFDLLAGTGALVTVDATAAPNVTGIVTATGDILTNGALVETGTLVNATTTAETIVYTICPFNDGANTTPESGAGDDCLASVVENDPTATTDANCVTYTLTVNPLPVVELGDPIVQCEGAGAITLDAGNAGATYLWSPNGETTQIIEIADAAMALTNYSVTVTDANGCVGTDDVDVTINANDDATFTIASPVCTNDATSAAAVVTGTPGGAFAFNPAATDGATIDAATGVVTAPVTGFVDGTSYTIEYTTTGTCPATSTQTLAAIECCPTVDASPIANETEICNGDAPTYVAPVISATAAANVAYLWTAPDGTTATTATPNFTLVNVGCAPVQVIVSYEISCSITNELLDAGSFPYTVYPSDITPFYSIVDGGCAGPTVTITDGCASNITITPQAGSPVFPLTATEVGTVNYDVVYTPTTTCIADAVEVGNYDCNLDAPSILIDKDDADNTDDTQAVNTGTDATFTITVTNNGNVDLENVTVTDLASPGCDNVYTDNGGILAVGDVWTYVCTTTGGVTDDFMNIATVTGDPVTGDPSVDSTDDTEVTVLEPSIAIDKDDADNTDDTQTVGSGQDATFTITVTNDGEVDLTGVTVNDPLTAGCDATYTDNGGVFVVGAVWVYQCSTTGGLAAGFDNVANVTGTPVGGGDDVIDSDETEVVVVTPSITINKDDADNIDDVQVINEGDDATFTITVTNTGTEDLINVVVTDPLTGNCEANIGDLAVGQVVTYTCTATNVTDSFTNIATVEGEGEISGETVNFSDPTEVLVASIEIVKDDADNTDDTQAVAPNGTATFTITVTNTGDVTLNNVTVTDAQSPNCDNTIGNLAIGESVSYECTIDNVTEAFTNIASVTGTPEGGGDDVEDEDDSDVTVEGTPSISIVKTALDGSDSQTINPGETAFFSITVTNTGDVDLSDVMVIDPLSPACDNVIGALPVGSFVTYVCQIDNVPAGFINTADVTGTPEDGSPDVEDEDDTVVEVTNPEITIVKSALDGTDTQTIATGATADFEITVTNTGDVNLENVFVSDPLSQDCNQFIGDLAIGESTSYFCSALEVQASFTNIANVTASPEGEGDDVSDEDPSDVVVEDPTNPGISIIKTALDGSDSQIVNPNGTATFVITVTNTGDVALNDVFVSDPMSPTCENTIGTLAVGETVTYECSIDNVTAAFTNIATVTGTPEDGSPEVEDEDPSEVELSNPSIEIVKDDADNSDDTQTVLPNGTATFTITVTNNGDVALENVIITDAQSPNCDMTFATLAVGASETYTCTLDNVAASFTNTAAVTATPEGGGDEVSDDDDSDVVVEGTPSITIVKDDADNTDDTQTIMEGETATFTITVTNNGDVNLTNVMVSDPMSPNCDMMFATLAVGASETYECSIDNVTASFTNVAIVTATPEDGSPDVSDEDTSEVVVEEVVTNPSIAITKTAEDGSDVQYVEAGGTATFTITVTNDGDVALENVMITDALSPDCDMMFAALAVGASETYTCTIDNVTASFTNVAVVTGTPEDGGDNVSDEDDTEVEVLGNPAILIEKNDADNQNDFQTIYEGGTATFTITVTNIGDEPLENIVITDPLSPNCDATYQFDPLMPGDLFSFECTIDGVMEDFVNVATVTATGTESGEEVTDEDDTYVNVVPEPIGCDVALTATAMAECNDNGTYNLTVSIEGGNGSFLVNGEATSATTYFVGTYADMATYNVVIEDAVGACSPVMLSATPETCIEPVEPEVCTQSITAIPDVVCNEDGTYNLFVSIFGGNGDYIVNGEETSAAYMLIGTFADNTSYTVTVADASGVCPPSTVTGTPESCVKDCEELIVSQNVACAADGESYEVVVIIVNGTAPFTASGDASGTYDDSSFVFGPFSSNVGFNIAIVDADGCAVNVSQNIVDCTVTAIELLSFEGAVEREGNAISWVSATENNNDYYILEQSTNGVDFKEITKVNAVGNSVTPTSYNFLDTEIEASVAYYRLLTIDTDGNAEIVSDVIALTRNVNTEVTISPVPATDVINVTFETTNIENANIVIYDVAGKQLNSIEIVTVNGANNLTIDVSNFASGSYFLQIIANNVSLNTKFIK